MSIDLHTSFFGFSERPFTLLPDPDFLFWSPVHARAYAILEYGIATRAPLTVVTGEVGAGKTTLVQKLLNELTQQDDREIIVGLISNAQGGRGDLLRWVLYALEIEVPEPISHDYVQLFHLFQDFLIEQYARGQHVLLIIDEAQNLSVEALEELRMFTNVNSNKDELLQLVLVGQPELRNLIERQELRQLAQRVVAAYHIRPLSVKDTQAYVRHRLVHVGGSGEEFTDAAIEKIHEDAGGIPRVINKMCDLSLVYAAAADQKVVDIETVDELLADSVFVKTRPASEVLVLGNPIFNTAGKAAE